MGTETYISRKSQYENSYYQTDRKTHTTTNANANKQAKTHRDTRLET